MPHAEHNNLSSLAGSGQHALIFVWAVETAESSVVDVNLIFEHYECIGELIVDDQLSELKVFIKFVFIPFLCI